VAASATELTAALEASRDGAEAETAGPLHEADLFFDGSHGRDALVGHLRVISRPTPLKRLQTLFPREVNIPQIYTRPTSSSMAATAGTRWWVTYGYRSVLPPAVNPSNPLVLDALSSSPLPRGRPVGHRTLHVVGGSFPVIPPLIMV
jgi:hypothetical protein